MGIGNGDANDKRNHGVKGGGGGGDGLWWCVVVVMVILLWEFCVSMIGRADIERSKSNVAMNAWLPQASYPFYNANY